MSEDKWAVVLGLGSILLVAPFAMASFRRASKRIGLKKGDGED
jgi:hypothetical protein